MQSEGGGADYWPHVPARGRRPGEYAERAKLLCREDVIKEIYFYTKLSLFPSLKCKCNHDTHCLEFFGGSPSLTTLAFKLLSFPGIRTAYETSWKPPGRVY